MNGLLFLLTLLCAATASELHIVEGGLSPDKNFAIAVVPQKEGEYVDEADGSVYLVKNPSKNILQRLENADSTGGTWGETTENLDCKWSPDGRFVAINMRTGRLTQDFVVYGVNNSKATPIVLPEENTNKKSEIYAVLDHTANPGEVFTAWLSPTNFTTEEYGLWPRQENTDFGRYGLPDFDGIIEKVYTLKGSHWILDDLRTPKEKK